ncbi:T9SS type A sorting domain-containing protein [Allomuricauda sp. d1]|uniref:T9SS type A sorting domain-containing protein n=1 Tax=Allomuricauda sp. d1 TaxID=3136725 RepID=UPI0031DD45FE
MKKYIIVLLILICTYVSGQVKYKVEYDYDLVANSSSVGAGASIEVYVTARLANGSSDASFLVTAFGAPGPRNIKREAILEYNSPIQSFDVFHFASSGNPTCPNNGITKNFPFSGSECTFLPFATSDFNDCVFFQQNGLQRLFPLDDFVTANPDFSETIPVCEGRDIVVSNYCGFKYKVEARIGAGSPITIVPYRENPRIFELNIDDIPGLDVNELFEIRIHYTENPSPEEISEWISSSFIACSPELQGAPVTKNETCSDSNDGSATLTFNDNVDATNGYEMRYYIYQNTSGAASPQDAFQGSTDNPNPPQAYEDLRLGALIDNGDGTFSGSTEENLESGQYYILYQEVNYNTNPVTVKSGELTPDFFTINSPSPVQLSVVNVVQPQCTGESGSVTLSATGGDEFETGTYEFSNDSGATWQSSPTFNDLEQGDTYDFSARLVLSENCSAINTESVTINTVTNSLTINAGSGFLQQPSNPTANDGSLRIITNNGVANYTYELFNAANDLKITEIVSVNTTEDFTALSEGTYYVVVTDGNDCSDTSANITLQAAPIPILGTPVINEISCLNAADGSITIPVSGGATPYTYQWIRNGTLFDFGTSSDSKFALSNLDDGTYELTVVSAGVDISNTAAAAQTSIFLVEPAEVRIDNIIANPISCNGAADGSIALTLSGGTSYEYLLSDDILFTGAVWTTLPASNIITIPNGGTYNLIIRNQNNCESTAITGVFINEPDILAVSELARSNITVNGGNDGSITIDVQGGTTPYTFNWTGPNGFTSSNQNLDNLIPGDYEVEVTDANNCIASLPQPITLTEPGPLQIISLNGTDVNCFGEASGSITANVNGLPPFNYVWERQGDAGFSAPNAPTIENLPVGTYTLRLTDASGDPEVTDTVIISEPLEILAATATTTDATCFDGADGAIQINASGGIAPYEYSLDNGATFQANPVFTSLTPNAYEVLVRDANLCTTTASPTIGQPQELSLVVDEQRSLTAANTDDGAISITITGGTPPYTYEWFADNGFASTDEDITNLAGGTYTLIVRDANQTNDADGCTLVRDFVIAEPGELGVTTQITTALECFGDAFGEIMATAQGGVIPYTYTWFEVANGNNIDLGVADEAIDNLSVGEYFVRVTDANNITVDSDIVSLTEPNPLQIRIDSVTDVQCSGEETGAIDISVEGGTLPYQYLWSNGAATEDLVNLPQGEYTIEVVDGNGCFVQETVVVDTPLNALQIDSATVTNVSEYAGNDGSIVLDISGGLSPYIISWTRLSDNADLGDQPTLSGLVADTYQVRISDANGCSVTETYEIEQPDIIDATITPPTCSGDSDGSISLVVNQGNGTFAYNWSTGATTNTISGLVAGSYTVTVTGFDEGPFTRTYVLQDPLPLQVGLGGDRVLCAAQELFFDVTVDDATATYEWTSNNGFSSTEPMVTITDSGIYTITINTASGCTASESITVDVADEEISAEFAVSSQAFVNESVIAVDISYPIPETVEWIVPEEATIVKNDSDELELVFSEAGEYEIGIITSVGQCIATQTKKILIVEKDTTITDEGETDITKNIDDFIIYPNPTDGRFTASITLTEQANISVKIFSFANNALMASAKERGASSYAIPFDLSGMPSGVYVVLLETPYGNRLQKVVRR